MTAVIPSLPATYVALYPYKPQKSDELELKKGCKWKRLSPTINSHLLTAYPYMLYSYILCDGTMSGWLVQRFQSSPQIRRLSGKLCDSVAEHPSRIQPNLQFETTREAKIITKQPIIRPQDSYSTGTATETERNRSLRIRVVETIGQC